MKKMKISSKANEIIIMSIKKKNNLDIISNCSVINIIHNNDKQTSFKIQNNYLQFVNEKRKRKIDKLILDSYINTLNLGFDKNKNYENYNNINEEKDNEDSDNENDRLECEPVPSFLLCIQKLKNNNDN